jgi:anti-sigma factor RsiW
MDHHNDDILLNYLDGLMTDDQAKALKSQLEESPALRERLELLRSIHLTLKQQAGLMQPSSNFTHRVMLNLHRLPVSAGLSPKNGLLLLGGVLVAVGMLAFLLSGGLFDNMTDSISLNSLPVSKEVIKNPLPTVAVNGKWIINGIVVLALGLSFVLLDRTILRPLFNKRSRLQF